MASIKRVNTNEEVHFERRDEELSLSTDNVKLQFCKITKIFWLYKYKFIFGILATIICGVLPVIKGYFYGRGKVALSSNYQTIR